MLRRFTALLGLMLATGLVWVAPDTAAHATTAQSPQLYCQVSNGTSAAGSCHTNTPQPYYSVVFTLTSVNSGSVTGWDPPTGNNYALGGIYGCQAGQLQCWLTVYPVNTEPIDITVTVHYHTTSIIVYQSSATAFMPGTCSVQC
jgi:hypothetical protein